MKKLGCALLCLAMLFTALPVWSAADDGGEPAAVYGAEEIGLLQSLGILEYTDEELTQPLARGEFFKLVCAAANYGSLAGAESRFRDLPADSEYLPYVNILSAMGLISGNAYGEVFPDRTITVQEAASVLVKVLGHGYPAEQGGGYPYGYLTIANRIKLFLGLDIHAEDAMTKGMAVRMLYNALEAERLVQSAFDGADSIKLEQGDTLLRGVHEVEHVTDVLEAVDITRLMGENDVEGFCIQIAGLTLTVYDIRNIYDFLGYHVDVYYRDLPSEQYGSVIYISKTDKNAETRIYVEDIIEVGGTALTYGDSTLGKRKKESYISGVPVLYNGVSTKQAFSMKLLEGKQGVVRLLDNNGDGRAEVVFADLYDNYVVGYADSEKYLLYDKFDRKKTILLDVEADDPYTIIYDEAGKEMSIDDLNTGTVLSVYQSLPDAYQQFIRAYSISRTVEGEITMTEDGQKYLTVNDERYRTNESCAMYSKDMMRLGAYVRLHLDVAGDVVYIDSPAEDGMTYAFIMAAAMTSLSFEKCAKLKLFTRSGEIIEAFASERLTLDGEEVKRTDAGIMDTLHQASQVMFGSSIPDDSRSSMIRFTRNAKGEINAIDTVLNGETGVATLRDDERSDQDALFMLQSASTDMLYYSTKNIGPQISLQNVSTTSIMYYPSPSSQNMQDESLYGVTTSGQVLRDNQAYSVLAFYTDPDAAQTEFLGIVYDTDVIGRLDSNSAIAVISGIGTGLDADGEQQIRFRVLIDGAESKVNVAKTAKVIGADKLEEYGIYAHMEPEQLKVGDVVFYTTNINKEMTNIYLYYRTENDTMVQNTGDSFTTHRGFAHGFVHSRLDNGFFVYYTDNADPSVMEGISSVNCQLTSMAARQPSYYRCTVQKDGTIKAEAVTENAMHSYKETGRNCSRVLMHRYCGRPQAVVILEKEE